ncbi:MAG TPA: type II toxin-antitoxin system PemK/MazF family toxin, partial [Thermoanaerobaculia bacterium]|nr:type II toxin-antitoxin system PemK/MazF family toxin [Thermoanaerobaculia bacterium]
MFVVVSRQALIDSSFSTVVCAPIYSRRDGLATQIDIGTEEGLKHESSLHCDELVSLLKSQLTNYLGSLSFSKLLELDRALAIALDLGYKKTVEFAERVAGFFFCSQLQEPRRMSESE